MNRWVCTALAFACALFPLPAVRAADVPDAATLRAKIDGARGTAPPSYHETITIVSGATTSTEHVFHVGKDVRHLDDTGPIHEEWGTYHGEDWHQNANGLTVADERDPRSDSSEGTSSSGAAANVVQSPDGLVISDLDRNGLGTRTTVDPATYHLKAIVETDRAGTITTTYDGYAACASLMLPSHWAVKTKDGTETVSRTECQSGGVFPSQVAEPGIKRLLADVPGDAPTQIPAKFDDREIYVPTHVPPKMDETRIFVPVTIGTHTFTFQLDSGASSIVIDSDAAKTLGLHTFNPETTHNAGAQTAYDAVVPDLAIGTVHMHDIVVDVEKVRDKSDDRGPALNGLLGFDFFATLGVSIDYAGKRVIVTPATTYKPPSDANSMALDIRLRTQQPEISVGLDGVQADRFVVDTGNGLGSYVVFDHFMDQHPKVGERFGDEVPVQGIGGLTEAHGFAVHSFRIGGWDFVDLNGYRIGQGSYEDATDGLIGPTFLKLFITDFDYAHGRMYLTPTVNTRRMLHLK